MSMTISAATRSGCATITHMTRITLATPALLFSAISLLMLAFTNRFLALASLVRGLHAAYKEKPDEVLYGQIRNLRTRLDLIRWMQVFGIASLLAVRLQHVPDLRAARSAPPRWCSAWGSCS